MTTSSLGRYLLFACVLAGCGGGGKTSPDGAAGSGATGRGGTTGSGGAATGSAGSGAAGNGAGGVTGTGGAAGVTGSGGTQGGDCTATPCTGFAYCDLASHQCKPGCAFDNQCATNETCNVTAHTCGCASGFHSCSGACASDTSTDTCGTSCSPCASPPANATATCSSSGTCGFKCNSGTFLCGGNCYPGTGMDQNVCGTSCAPCPVKANATAKCSSGQCSYTCQGGYAWGASCQRCYMTGSALGDACTTTADCCAADSGRACVSGHCIFPYGTCNYTVSGQCETGTSCLGPPGGFGLCEPSCKTSADCPQYPYDNTKKASCDGTNCYFYCSTPSDCPAGLNSCGSGRCL